MQTLSIIIKGRVQGVGFRLFTYQNALKFNIKGYVSNSITQTNIVEVLAQGEEYDILNFLKKIQEGPILSRVESISQTKLSKKDLNNFIIK